MVCLLLCVEYEASPSVAAARGVRPGGEAPTGREPGPSSPRSDGVARALSDHGLALWPFCTPETGKTYASRRGWLLGLLQQEVREKKRYGMLLPLVRQKVTGNTPPWRAGQDRARRQPSATLVAGATNVAPVVRIHSIPALEEGPPWQRGETNTTGTTGRWQECSTPATASSGGAGGWGWAPLLFPYISRSPAPARPLPGVARRPSPSPDINQ